MYHYATVSKALDELNENGFTYDFNLHEQDAKKTKNMRLNTFTAMKEILILEMKSYDGNQIRKKGVFVAGFANSISDAAQVLINISIKNRIK
jgi:hypothetical protein